MNCVDLLRQKRPLVIAHRGYSARYPENTLAAFAAALEIEADAIELDITLTADRQLVVIHDETLDRTTNGSGLVRNHTLSELRQLDAGSWFDSRFSGERIPTLIEVLDLVQNRILLNVEIKPEAYESEHPADAIEQQLLCLLREKNLEHSVIISSFHHDLLQDMQSQFVQIARAALYDPIMGPLDPNSICETLGTVAFNPHHESLTPNQVTSLHESGHFVFPYTVNSPQRMQTLLEWGVDGLFTDDPLQLKQVLKNNS